jgi:hypothetical protein
VGEEAGMDSNPLKKKPPQLADRYSGVAKFAEWNREFPAVDMDVLGVLVRPQEHSQGSRERLSVLVDISRKGRELKLDNHGGSNDSMQRDSLSTSSDFAATLVMSTP